VPRHVGGALAARARELSHVALASGQKRLVAGRERGRRRGETEERKNEGSVAGTFVL
jgi:hypothetical protein